MVTNGGNLGLRVSHERRPSPATPSTPTPPCSACPRAGRRRTRPPRPRSPPAPAAPIPGQQIQLTDTSTDSDGTIAARAWDLDNDGQFDDGTRRHRARSASRRPGTYTVRLQVTDDDGDPGGRDPPDRPRRRPAAQPGPDRLLRPDPRRAGRRPAGELLRHLDRLRRHRRRARLGSGRRRPVRRRHGRLRPAHLRRGRHLHRAPAGDRRRRRAGDRDPPGGRQRRAGEPGAQRVVQPDPGRPRSPASRSPSPTPRPTRTAPSPPAPGTSTTTAPSTTARAPPPRRPSRRPAPTPCACRSPTTTAPRRSPAGRWRVAAAPSAAGQPARQPLLRDQPVGLERLPGHAPARGPGRGAPGRLRRQGHPLDRDLVHDRRRRPAVPTLTAAPPTPPTPG